ncbi:helicase HerA domain-containing protein [Lyngbya confervoides]|uniref:DUF87 domain-containing protein n=1 Tax=Lyngbya confervoides BDU141951 TaxID=1574623 RepID=A0ABD4T0P8_9CYAN|nr:DUF87 domain-containing protein [Lyngbya confervoides]MCM1982147.1 DUF87 domain-containing protein [Lyngbya confervoides BDU141951]
MPTTAPAIENDIDLTNVVSVCNGDQTVQAILNARGSKKQFVFIWELEPLHDTAITETEYEAILAGLKELSKGELLTFVSSSSGDPESAIARLERRLEGASQESQFFIHGMTARIKELTRRGERKERSYYAFATYTIRDQTGDAEDLTERFLASTVSFFKKNVSKSEAWDAESITLMLHRVYDAWAEWNMLLGTKMGLKGRPFSKDELWEYLRSKINGESWPIPLPHCLSLQGQQLKEQYFLKSKRKIAVQSHRLHMSSLLVNPNAVPKADQNLFLPARKAYVGVVRLKQLPDGFENEAQTLRWLWEEVAAQEPLIDFDIISQFSRGNEKDAMQAAQRYAFQQESMQRVSSQKGGRDRIAEYRADEAGDVQISLIQGDIPINVAIAICIYVFVEPGALQDRKAHQRAVETLRSKVNFVKNRFKHPAAAIREENYPWRTWLQTLPLKVEPLYARPYDFRHPVNASAAVGFTQLVGINNRAKYGTELISEKGSTPVHLSLNDSLGSPRHLAFFGKTGSGKSTLVALFIINALIQGIPVTIMDYPKGKQSSTYTWLLKFYGGEEYDTGTTCNNLLEYLDLSDIPEEEHKLRIANFCKNITNLICSLVLDGEDDLRLSKSTIRSLIELGVSRFYSNSRIMARCEAARQAGIGTPEWDNWPTLHDYYHLFTEENLIAEDFGSEIPKAIKYIRYRLYTWLESDLGQAIASPSSFDGSSNLALFALRNISSNQEAAILGLSAQTAAMRKAFSSTRSLFYCDEVSVLLRFTNLAYVIGTFLATGRANGLSVLLASQDPVALQQAPKDVAAQILQNLSVKLIGKIADRGAIACYQEVFGYDFKTLLANASSDFFPSPSAIYSRWLVDDDGQITPCRYYPPANILGIVANNPNEVLGRSLFEKRYENEFEALGRYSKWLWEQFKQYSGETEEIITQEHIQALEQHLFGEESKSVLG